MATFSDFGVLVIGIVGYRGLQLSTFDIITGVFPCKNVKGFIDSVRRRLQMQSERLVEEPRHVMTNLGEQLLSEEFVDMRSSARISS
mmetsp:Transcript_129072/g.401514  ORF Transcript_129072/g.401514 Transcript_129072/m.401514 type:complete len:87 (+) Transcript_129072:148-408(+)